MSEQKLEVDTKINDLFKKIFEDARKAIEEKL